MLREEGKFQIHLIISRLDFLSNKTLGPVITLKPIFQFQITNSASSLSTINNNGVKLAQDLQRKHQQCNSDL